ncbi:MAG: hypothetical protein CO032_03105 [Nitrosopumilales archaeon CG_4_9_14_0_2_um_filter_34_16]|nr:MAG: hypothetical protein CO032_03105 [Nitrosopumilales archaeon CG_4_9_14_0_2_um_filter_34_16]
MNNKDIINKISGVVALSMMIVITLGYVIGNNTLWGIPNSIMLYVTLPAGLIWFGTRKNGCGSCNQVS